MDQKNFDKLFLSKTGTQIQFYSKKNEELAKIARKFMAGKINEVLDSEEFKAALKAEIKKEVDKKATEYSELSRLLQSGSELRRNTNSQSSLNNSFNAGSSSQQSTHSQNSSFGAGSCSQQSEGNPTNAFKYLVLKNEKSMGEKRKQFIGENKSPTKKSKSDIESLFDDDLLVDPATYNAIMYATSMPVSKDSDDEDEKAKGND